ncbi:flavin monoamine oxidase family protein [Kiloniella laminariae]|uniref:flavin monoamine oxidase family protein n=1 Tax=Kiloniella laminariae TaxID=454162 RepID=UPI000362D10C|nr:FAD-dependent oxidoreductase [Kiloniella laminariae]
MSPKHLVSSCENIIVGGGLSGLYLAYRLQQTGKDFLLLEARDRLGGRILGHLPVPEGPALDLGPTWFWPGQEQLERLLRSLEIPVFKQQNQGDLLYEDQFVIAERISPQAYQMTSYRMNGGFIRLVESLRAALPQKKLLLSHQVRSIKNRDGSASENLLIDATPAGSASSRKFSAQRAFLALPPRLVAEMISFQPTLPQKTLSDMMAIPTWMAGQAKALITYDRPFWRDQHLSGQAFSRLGPMMEIHDASTEGTGPYGLFGFLGGTSASRAPLGKDQMTKAIQEQLNRLFGNEATLPLDITIKDWAQDPFTATISDQQPLKNHPHYSMPESMKRLWDGRLIFTGTEVASRDGGYLEGALVAANEALLNLI